MRELEQLSAEAKPHDVLLVLDSMMGQEAVSVSLAFSEHVAFDGIVLTKLDGSAKGGIVLPVAVELGLPVKLIRVGERLEDLRPFDAGDFARALVGSEGE